MYRDTKTGEDLKSPPDNKSPDNKFPDNKSPDNKSPDNKSPDNKSPDNKSPDNESPDNKSGKNDWGDMGFFEGSFYVAGSDEVAGREGADAARQVAKAWDQIYNHGT